MTASPEHRVFFALQPDAAAADAMVRLAGEVRRKHGMNGRVTPAGRLHLSLNFVSRFQGPPTRAVVEKAIAVADTIQAPTFKISLNRIQSWAGDPGPLALFGEDGVIGVEMLQAALHKALVLRTMAPRRPAEFRPHVALLWDRREAQLEPVEPISWTADDFVLLDSVFGEGRHEVLGRWRLTTGASFKR